MDENSGTIAPLKITINGQEFDESEAQEYIDLGRKTKENEQKWNTSLDNVWPDYGRVTQERKQLAEERDALKAEVESFRSKREEGTETPTDLREAQEAARKLGIVLSPDLDKAGYIKKADLDSYFNSKKEEEQAINAVLGQADNLEKELDGSDGRPKFNKRAVLAYASAYKFNNLQDAYNDMNKDVIDAWKAGQMDAQRNRGLKTLKGQSASKEPKQPKIDSNNFRQALGEALDGSE